MLMSDLMRSLAHVRNIVSSCDIPLTINGLSIDLLGVNLVDDDDKLVLNIRIQSSQVEGLKPETQLS